MDENGKPAFKAGDKVVVKSGNAYLNATVIDKHPDVTLTGYVWLTPDALPNYGMRIEESCVSYPYADYPGGADQYAADVATLGAAGALGDKATDDNISFYRDCYGDKAAYPDNDTEYQILSGAADTARALSRFMPWALARLGAA